ncbi:hypothetical protein Ahy_A09g044301 [Arachis hypogaea]|uniref:Replication factor A C-terminal domain-containing protein n=1 Tax=Arachis hypogaea TaxID=3818 RepID=A0A445BJT4_ARAHY|nr:hypothetical protein Ahy_A09g044301 [Arachis hypogaea]
MNGYDDSMSDVNIEDNFIPSSETLDGTNILQNIMYGTRFLINPNVPEAVMLRKSVYYREISQYLSVLSGKLAYVNKDEVLYCTERKTIKELRVAANVGFYVILATVLDVEPVLSWWYKSCICSMNAEANTDTYFCDDCNKDVNNVNIMYGTKLLINLDVSGAVMLRKRLDSVILATILDVEPILSWWYKSYVCSIKAEANVDTYFCDGCNKDVNNVVNRYDSNWTYLCNLFIKK